MKIRNANLIKYLRLVEDTEPPLLHHIWSLLGVASACLGRRCFYKLGSLEIFPNQYILLVGDPAIRKSTAMGFAKRLIKGSNKIRLAPDDTGGQRQGLIISMLGDKEETKDTADYEFFNSALDALAEMNPDNQIPEDMLPKLELAVEDRHTMFVYASEFATFLGQSNYELIVFLTKTWDGEDHNYVLKNSQLILDKPLLNLLGGTTPVAIANALPAEVVGQGFLSRVILVYAEAGKRVARPKEFDTNLLAHMEKTFDMIQTFHGVFAETKEAQMLIDSLYEANLGNVADSRFGHYNARRHTHLIKLCMSLAAIRGSQTIILDDIQDAQEILKETEYFMPSALGEFGLSKDSRARQRLLDVILVSNKPFTGQQLYLMVSKDMAPNTCRQCLVDFVNQGKVTVWQDNDGVAYYAGVKKTKIVKLEEML